MSWRDAPLYVEAFDLSCWLVERTAAWEHRSLARLVTAAAVDLVSAVSLALTFPAARRRYLMRSDEGVVRLRTVLRIAQATGLLSNRGLRFAAGRLAIIGRMVGGWRKRLAKRSRSGGAAM